MTATPVAATVMVTMRPTSQQLDDLVAAARAACASAYAPYSRFRVGAACLGGSGRIHAGANVENASYGLSMCAERSAIFRALSSGEDKILAVAIYTPTAEPVTPCGACRQVLCEFGDAIDVISCCEDGTVRSWTSGALLPERFRL